MKVRHIIVGGGDQVSADVAALMVETLITRHAHGADDIEVTVIPGSAALTWLSDDLE